MATKNPRINVTFDETTANLLGAVSKKSGSSVAGLVKELTIEALERREDIYLSNIANKLDKKGVKTISHDQAWK